MQHSQRSWTWLRRARTRSARWGHYVPTCGDTTGGWWCSTMPNPPRRARETEADGGARVLGDLPLALAQAAGFLAETGMPVDHYLGLLETRTEELLDQSPPESHPLSLAAAIRVSTG